MCIQAFLASCAHRTGLYSNPHVPLSQVRAREVKGAASWRHTVGVELTIGISLRPRFVASAHKRGLHTHHVPAVLDTSTVHTPSGARVYSAERCVAFTCSCVQLTRFF